MTNTESHYQTNAQAYDDAMNDATEWSAFQDPADVQESMRNHLLGALLAATNPEDFADMLHAAAQFAGRPLDFD